MANDLLFLQDRVAALESKLLDLRPQVVALPPIPPPRDQDDPELLSGSMPVPDDIPPLVVSRGPLPLPFDIRVLPQGESSVVQVYLPTDNNDRAKYFVMRNGEGADPPETVGSDADPWLSLGSWDSASDRWVVVTINQDLSGSEVEPPTYTVTMTTSPPGEPDLESIKIVVAVLTADGSRRQLRRGAINSDMGGEGVVMSQPRLPFDVRLQGGNVEVYLPDDEESRAAKYVIRNGLETSVDAAGTVAEPWVSLGAWGSEDGYKFVVVKVVSGASFEGGMWPDNHGQAAGYVVSVTATPPTDYEATMAVIALLVPDTGVVQLRRGAINNEYALLDGEVEQHGDEPANWFRSLNREGTGDRVAGWYDFRSPTFRTELDKEQDAFPFRHEPASGTDPTEVRYIKWGDLLSEIESALPGERDWWDYGPDGETWPCVEDTVFVWDPCAGDWTRKKFWVSGDQDGSTTYGNQIYDAAGPEGSKGTLAVDIADRQLTDRDEVVSLDWDNRNALGATGISIDWLYKWLMIGTLGDEVAVVDWGAQVCNDTDGTPSVDWANRVCKDSDGYTSVDWENHLLRIYESVGEQQRTRIDWDDCVMYDKVSLLAIKWASRELYDDAQQKAVTYKGAVRELHGDWKAASMAAVHKTAAGGAAVANGTYTVGIGPSTDGTITVTDGIITAVQEAS